MRCIWFLCTSRLLPKGNSNTDLPVWCWRYKRLSIYCNCTHVGFVITTTGRSTLFKHLIRILLVDYSTVATVVLFTGFPHIGQMVNTHLMSLPVNQAFHTTTGRGWLVEFWTLSAEDVFTAIPFGILLTILFYFDHNGSSLMAQGTEYPLKKPPGFHWDIFLLGITTGVAGILGLPAPSGLIPLWLTHRSIGEFRTAIQCSNFWPQLSIQKQPWLPFGNPQGSGRFDIYCPLALSLLFPHIKVSLTDHLH